MTTFVALLRAINVGGTGLLPMKDLSALCVDLGFENVRTYIQSGNVIFDSSLSEADVKTELEWVLEARMDNHVDVLLRSAKELRSILEANPFPNAKPAQVGVMFLHEGDASTVVEWIVPPGGEEVRRSGREVFVHYPNGMGQSKLKLPPIGPCTTRNLNTVAKLVAMSTG